MSIVVDTQDKGADEKHSEGLTKERHHSIPDEERLRHKKRSTRRFGLKVHHHRTKKTLDVSNFDKIDGLGRVVLTEDVQKFLRCYVGEDVTSEKPWTRVLKNFIQEQVESDEVPPEWETFMRFKSLIVNYPNDDMMIGYIPDEKRGYDEFFLCMTEAAEEAVNLINARNAEIQRMRFENAINKRVGRWKSMGSDAEIREDMLRPTRGFYTVEVEARYPILNADVQFRLREADQARDGYMELQVPARNAVAYVQARRISRAVQAAPSSHESVAQTFCAFPMNAWTQYEYQCRFVEHITKDFQEVFGEFAKSRMTAIDDQLYVNDFMNFYTSDYKALKNDGPMEGEVYGEYKEYQSFYDVKRCKDKMISAVCWHPMWTGVIVIAYANLSPRWYRHGPIKVNVIDEIVHGYNPILLWSFDDNLSPKLLLETNNEVHCLAFCPHDPNLLVGGCVNGQVILWDIKNKLSKVENEEILTSAQQNYRTRLFADMGWMKNTRNYAIVPPTAVSQLFYSHHANVTSIQWMDPLFYLNRNGHVVACTESDPSLEFATSSSDGSIKFWDLKQKPVVLAGDFKPPRRSRRLAKIPSAMTVDVSPYKILNRRLLPHYQLRFGSEEIKCPLAGFMMFKDNVQYKEENPDPNRIFNINERIVYYPLISAPTRRAMSERMVVGTYLGEMMLCSWQGFEYSSGEICTAEDPKILNVAKYHDGPVMVIENNHHTEDVYMTIGGKVFAIWSSALKDRPIIWRRSRDYYTYGNWSSTNISGIRMNKSDGSREYWNFDTRSDLPYAHQIYSGKALFEGIQHALPLKTRVLGLADDRGTMRLIYTPHHEPANNEGVAVFERFVANNVERHKDFEVWQKNWLVKNAASIKQQLEAEMEVAQKKHDAEVERAAYEEEMRARAAVEAAKRAAAKSRPPPGRFQEWAHERWIVKEQERMGMELLAKKRLNKETLIVQQKPLKVLEEVAARKHQKIKQRLSKVDEIFNDTVAMLFPNLSMGAERFEKDEISELGKEEVDEVNKKLVQNFKDSVNDYAVLIEENPFVYEFDWREILENSKARKMKDDFRNALRHSDRHKVVKIVREETLAEYFPAESTSQVSDEVSTTLFEDAYEEDEQFSVA